jgi:hypothetical protein
VYLGQNLMLISNNIDLPSYHSRNARSAMRSADEKQIQMQNVRAGRSVRSGGQPPTTRTADSLVGVCARVMRIES